MAFLKAVSSGTILTLVILVHSYCIHAVSLGLREYDPNVYKESKYPLTYEPPNPDMIKALEFIENLRRQNGEGKAIPEYDGRVRFNPFQGTPLYTSNAEEADQENQQTDDTRGSLDDDRAEWAKLLLSALRQTESQKASASRTNDKYYSLRKQYQQPEEETIDLEGNQQDYDGYPLPESGRRGRLPRKHYISFPEEMYPINPYKRTNEIVEEQYTPQSLATLESAFQELGKYTGAYKKQRGRLEEDRFGKVEEEDEENSRGNDMAYDDVAGGEEWNSVEVKNRHQQKELQFRDDETEVDNDSEETEDNAKKSLAGFNEMGLNRLDSQEKALMEKENQEQMSDAAVDLMLQYYKRMQEGQAKRGQARNQDTNVDKEKMATKRFEGSEDEMNPQMVDQLIELSSKLQIPPDDIIEMLKDAKQKQAEMPFLAEEEGAIPQNVARVWKAHPDREGRMFRESYSRTHAVPDYNMNENLTTEDILNVLGMDDKMYEKPGYLTKADQSENVLPRMRGPLDGFKDNRIPKPLRFTDGLDRGQADYDDVNLYDEELARYLERLLAKNPKLLNAIDLKRVRMPSSSDIYQNERDNSQDPIKELLRKVDSEKAAEIMSMINSLSSFTGNDNNYIPQRQQSPEDPSNLILKLAEIINQQNAAIDDRDRYIDK
ncbi:secretogranin-2 [Callorhinchus milii]|uniref:Secretogranin II n=1 Tax=Callorhinchus milii TaxID=7868 RepID=V9KEX2_CALMI|nr:secretogranin-2 [Callorhinchus milii]